MSQSKSLAHDLVLQGLPLNWTVGPLQQIASADAGLKRQAFSEDESAMGQTSGRMQNTGQAARHDVPTPIAYDPHPRRFQLRQSA